MNWHTLKIHFTTFNSLCVFIVFLCSIALPSPNQANQQKRRDSKSRSRSKSRSQSPAHRQATDDQIYSASPSPERSANNNTNNNNKNNDEEHPQPSAPLHPNTDNNNNINIDNTLKHFSTAELMSVCMQYSDAPLNTNVSRSSLIQFIASVMDKTRFTSVASFIYDILHQINNMTNYHSSSLSHTHASRSRSRASSHHRRSSKSSNNNNNNNDDMQLSSSKSKSISSSRRRRSKSRSHSKSHSPRRHHHHSSSSRHDRRASRSRSSSRRKHHHHSSSSSSSSSSRRPRSRDRSHSHSRDRSASPTPQALSVPDPLALQCKPIPTDQLKALAAGKYITMPKLIRPYLPASHAESVQVEVAPNVFLSQTPKPKNRSITTPLDWFEVMFSSILPSQAQRILDSSTHDDALKLATTLQQHICYALHAIPFFRTYPNHFSYVFKYLEAHRTACMNASPQLNIAVPDTHLKQDMHQSIFASTNTNTNTNNRSSTSNSHSSSSHKKSHQQSRFSNNTNTSKTATTHNDCGDFNSFKGCSRGTACKYAHTCRHCKSADHGKTSCAGFKSTQDSKKQLK